MGKIQKILLNNYRNFQSCKISFNNKCNILFGKNGSGKTNILESISLLGKGRGFRNANLSNLIYKNEKNFLINSDFKKDDNNYNIRVECKIVEDKLKKKIKINDDASKEAIDFLNTSLSFLYFLPEMERLFLSSPSYRRNFVDKLVFAEKNYYNKIVNKYKKNLLERSKLLQSNIYDESWINTLENEICEIGLEIYKIRLNQIEIINDNLVILNSKKKYPYNSKIIIKDGFYDVDLDHEKYLFSLKKYRDYDKKFGGSKVGPHKSDFIVLINEDIDASLLSTGQQKTLVLMILIAECNYLINTKNITPIVLFDEICSHLDSVNRQLLLEMTDLFDIQFFLTGTEKSLFSFISTNADFYNISEL